MHRTNSSLRLVIVDELHQHGVATNEPFSRFGSALSSVMGTPPQRRRPSRKPARIPFAEDGQSCENPAYEALQVAVYRCVWRNRENHPSQNGAHSRPGNTQSQSSGNMEPDALSNHTAMEWKPSTETEYKGCEDCIDEPIQRIKEQPVPVRSLARQPGLHIGIEPR